MMLDESADPVAAYVSEFRRRHVLVLGDAMLDEYLLGDCSRISPEAPVPVLKVNTSRQVLGGAANTAANVVSLGGQATLIALVGNDDGGLTLRRCAADARIELLAVDHGLTTLRKTRVIGQQQQIVRLDYEEIPTLDAASESEILGLVDARARFCDIVVISDYAKGFLSPSLSQEIIRRTHEAGRQVIIDPRPQNRECYRGCDYLTPNWRESRALLGLPDADPTPDAVAAVARAMASELDTNVVLTLGRHGISFCSRNGTHQFGLPTLAREVFDVSGAGDTVVAAFALARASGADHASALALANRAASVVVGKFGTATVTSDEILQGTDAARLVPRHALRQLATTLRAQGKRIATIVGSFERLDEDHLHVLTETRHLADVLIVGLIGDASRNGATRSIKTDWRRAEMLLALRMVDYVHILTAPTPAAFLDELKPDVHIDGCPCGETAVEHAPSSDAADTVDVLSSAVN